MTEGQFLTMLRNRGVIPTTLIEQIRAQIAWQGVIQRRVRPNVEIAPEEVEEVVARLAARRGTVERRVAEIFVPIESAAQEEAAMANARRLVDELRRGANFARPAAQVSKSRTALLRGHLRWVTDRRLADQSHDGPAQAGPHA